MRPMTLSSGRVVELLRAVGEPTRLRILALLGREELAVLELCRILDQSQPRVSRHLKLLLDAHVQCKATHLLGAARGLHAGEALAQLVKGRRVVMSVDVNTHFARVR